MQNLQVSRISIGIVAFGYLLAATPLNLMTIDALIKYKKRNGVNIQSSEKVRLIVNWAHSRKKKLERSIKGIISGEVMIFNEPIIHHWVFSTTLNAKIRLLFRVYHFTSFTYYDRNCNTRKSVLISGNTFLHTLDFPYE